MSEHECKHYLSYVLKLAFFGDFAVKVFVPPLVDATMSRMSLNNITGNIYIIYIILASSSLSNLMHGFNTLSDATSYNKCTFLTYYVL